MNWYFVYALYDRNQNRFYIGSTNDLDRRVAEHRRGSTYTTYRMPDAELIYYEASISAGDARARERQLKTGFGRGYLRKRVQNFLNRSKE